MKKHLEAPQTKGHVSVANIRDHWYVACRTSELKKRPIARKILGLPLVLFRTASGSVGALLDRCPHRNVPLSVGDVVGETVQCKYHGWTFDCSGSCQSVPGLFGGANEKGRRVESFPTRERDGLIWVYPTAGATPEKEPFVVPYSDTPGYHTIVREVSAESTLHAIIENALDVPHTAFLHKGLFRGVSEPNEIEVVVRRWADRVEAEYIGEPRPEGIVARLLSPSGGEVTHFDRFILPSIAQVEYRIGTENHILVSALCTPVDDFFTRLTAVVRFKLRVPGMLVRTFEPLGLRIFKQDADILTLQTETIRAFGGEKFVSTELDALGPQIWRLLRQAERGGPSTSDDEPVERRFTIRV